MQSVQRIAGLSTAARSLRRGFTLVEILIVVVILAILAALVVPQFSSAANEARENSLKTDLYRIRQQVEVYKQQHNGDWPALAKFAAQLTQTSRGDGTTSANSSAGYKYGPYLQQIPVNPFTGNNVVKDGDVGTSDWYYDQTTGVFRANDSTKHREY